MDRNNRRQKVVKERRTARGFLQNRNILVVSLLEVFFRVDMGRRYFTKGLFLVSLVGLFSIRFLITLSNFFTFSGFDVFILLYIGLSIYHFSSQNRLALEGRSPHSFYIGDSRFAFLGKYLNKEKPNFAAWVYIEPLATLVIFFPLSTHSVILTVGTLIGAGRLWYENYRTVRSHWHDEIDRTDQQKEAQYASGQLHDEEATDGVDLPPIPNGKAQEPILPPLPLIEEDEEDLTPMEAMKRIKNNRTN